MNYSFDELSAISECDALLFMAEKEKDNLEFRKTILARDKAEALLNGPDVDQELSVITTEINALKSIFDSLAAGDTKNVYEDRIKRAELRKRVLTKRDANYGLIAGITIELKIARIVKEIEELTAFIAALTQKKSTL